MDTFSAVQAGRWLGFTERTVRNMINRGELRVVSADPIRLDPGHVDEVLRDRQADVTCDLVRMRKSAVQLARETVEVLRPRNESAPLPDRVATHQRLKLSLVPDSAKLMFGTASLTAALADDGCRWCKAKDFAAWLGTWGPERYSEGFAELFGQAPCAKCGPGLYGPLMDALKARVHPPGVGPSAAAVAPTADERARALEWVQRRPVTPAARPVGDDDGRAMVARRRREVQARLTAAKRAGDQRYAIQLRTVLQSLTADASVVDGRAGAAARPGRLRCGHLLSAGCGCPRPSARSAR